MTDRDPSACRELLATCRPEWVAGHGDTAWTRLAQAEVLAGDDPALRVEALAARAGLHLLAEQPEQGIRSAREAVALGSDLAPASLEQPTRLALADTRVTLATLVPGSHGTRTAWIDSAQRSPAEWTAALAVLDEIAHDPDLADTGPAARAANNALLLRIEQLQDRFGTTAGQVEAWMQVSATRMLIRGWTDQGTILRQAVDLGTHTGQWERAWAAVQEQRAAADAGVGPNRNELIAVLAKGARLAWDRRMMTEARDLGERARSLSVAVDHPWVRTYAFYAGAIAAAAVGQDLGTALTAYTRCTTRAGHASRPNRAWRVATVALEAGHSTAAVETFLRATLPDGLADLADQAAVLRADARGEELDQAALRRLQRQDLSAPSRARLALATARWHRHHGRLTAAVLELQAAQGLLRDYPGRLLEAVNAESSLVHEPVVATDAQRRVLDLLAEGLTNREIAAVLDLGERTVAVHVGALLRVNEVTTRTALAAHHLRSQLFGAGLGTVARARGTRVDPTSTRRG